MNAGLQTSTEYLEIWHAYLDFLRRNLYSNKEKKIVSEDEIETVRDTFRTAINQLYECSFLFFIFLNLLINL